MRTPFTPSILILFLILTGHQLFSQNIKSRSAGESSWNRELAVKTTEAKFGDELLPSYMITIYDADEKAISKYWKDYLKTRGGKVSTKDGVQGEGVMFTDIHDKPVEIFTTFEPGSDNALHMHIAFIADSMAMNPDDHPEAHDKIMPAMEKLSLEMNKAVVGHQIESQEEILEDLQDQLGKLQKENESLRGAISKNTQRIEKAKQSISDAEADLAGANSQLEVYTTKENPTASDLKTVDKLRKKVSKLNSGIAKDKQNITKYESEIQKAEATIPTNEDEQERLKVKIEEQKEVVDQYRAKKEAIN